MVATEEICFNPDPIVCSLDNMHLPTFSIASLEETSPSTEPCVRLLIDISTMQTADKFFSGDQRDHHLENVIHTVNSTPVKQSDLCCSFSHLTLRNESLVRELPKQRKRRDRDRHEEALEEALERIKKVVHPQIDPDSEEYALIFLKELSQVKQQLKEKYKKEDQLHNDSMHAKTKGDIFKGDMESSLSMTSVDLFEGCSSVPKCDDEVVISDVTLEQASSKIQALYRRYMIRSVFSPMLEGVHEHEKLQRATKACTIIQAHFRMFECKKLYTSLVGIIRGQKALESKSSVRIQSAYRRYQIRKFYSKLLGGSRQNAIELDENQATIRIQAACRRYLSQRALDKLLCEGRLNEMELEDDDIEEITVEDDTILNDINSSNFTIEGSFIEDEEQQSEDYEEFLEDEIEKEDDYQEVIVIIDEKTNPGSTFDFDVSDCSDDDTFIEMSDSESEYEPCESHIKGVLPQNRRDERLGNPEDCCISEVLKARREYFELSSDKDFTTVNKQIDLAGQYSVKVHKMREDTNNRNRENLMSMSTDSEFGGENLGFTMEKDIAQSSHCRQIKPNGINTNESVPVSANVADAGEGRPRSQISTTLAVHTKKIMFEGVGNSLPCQNMFCNMGSDKIPSCTHKNFPVQAKIASAKEGKTFEAVKTIALSASPVFQSLGKKHPPISEDIDKCKSLKSLDVSTEQESLVLPLQVGKAEKIAEKETAEQFSPLFESSKNVKNSGFKLEDFEQNQVNNVDMDRWEEYLSDEEFKKHFSMSKEEFTKQPKWKRDKQKRSVRVNF